MDEVGWEALKAWASIISAICAMVAAAVSVAVWRKARVSDLGARIEGGDREIKAHVDRSVSDVRRANSSAIQGILETVKELQEQSEATATAVARIETDCVHMLRPRDLGRLHEKINAVATDSASTRATVDAVREQVGVIYKLLLKERP